MSEPDLSEFVRLSRRDQRKPCRVGAALGMLSAEDRKLLEAALAADPLEITAGGIIPWLAERGIKNSPPAIANHRKRECSCYG